MTHPKILEQYEVDGWSKDADVDSENFAALQQVKFLLSPPAARVEGLQHIDGLIAENDGASLRAKSELFDLRRKLSLTYNQMLKAKR